MPSAGWAHFRAWRKSYTHRAIAPKEPKVMAPSWNQEGNTPGKNHQVTRWPRQARAEGLKWLIHFQQGRCKRVRLREEKERWNKSSEMLERLGVLRQGSLQHGSRASLHTPLYTTAWIMLLRSRAPTPLFSSFTLYLKNWEILFLFLCL